MRHSHPPHYIRNRDGDFVHRPGYCTLTDTFYGPPETFGTVRKPGWIRPMRIVMLALGIAAGITGFYLSGLILALGSLVLHPFDRS